MPTAYFMGNGKPFGGTGLQKPYDVSLSHNLQHGSEQEEGQEESSWSICSLAQKGEAESEWLKCSIS